MIDDARFSSIAARIERRDALLPVLEKIFLEREAARWIEVLDAADVPVGPVNDSRVRTGGRPSTEPGNADHHAGGVEEITEVPPQMQPTPGLPERQGDHRRTDHVMRLLHTLPEPAQEAIITSLFPEQQRYYGVRPHRLAGVTSHL